MNPDDILLRADACFASGELAGVLAHRIAIQTESQNPARRSELDAYLQAEMTPALEALGFHCEIHPNPVDNAPPFLLARRIEADAAFTLLSYGHGDVVPGAAAQWREGLSPWKLTEQDGRWYGRGSADNKGQHTINLAALGLAIAARGGKLGFNVKLIFEMGEEIGSPGLDEFCRKHREALQADLFLASDGPRINEHVPTLFLGSRGGLNFDLQIVARKQGYHSGNWGGLLSNPAIRLSHAIASCVDARGRILVDGLLPPDIPPAVREALTHIPVGGGANDPAIDADWGEPGLSAAEKVIAWNNFEVLAFEAGNPAAPVNAIPASARACCQLRFAPGMDEQRILPALREHLQRHGFDDVIVIQASENMPASRLDPDNAWVRFVMDSIHRATGKQAHLLPNLGGTLPNYVFSRTLGLPTIWLPHSYAACAQHSPNEHVTAEIVREALRMMSALFFDLGQVPAALR